MALIATEKTELVPTPGKPVSRPVTPFDDIYTLTYIHRKHLERKTFYATGSIQDIVGRAKAHCEKMSFRFLHVDPFLADFVEDERKHAATY